LNSGADYEFLFEKVQAPFPYEANSGEIRIIFSDGSTLKKIFSLMTSYPILDADSFTGTSMTCDSLQSIVVGKNGNLDCAIAVPFALITFPITNIQINFDNTGNTQIKTMHPECNAYFSSSTTVIQPPQGQLLCSRQDSTANKPSIFVSGFAFDADYTVYIRFKAAILTDNKFTVTVLLQVDSNPANSALMTQLNYDLLYGSYVSTTCKFSFGLSSFLI